MTPERRRLALRAMGRALKLRQQNGIAPDQPCCVYDLAERIGVEVRFAEIPSAEGIYSPGKPVIVISSLRPAGRQAFTCAHELGHHAYGHGERFDEVIEERGIARRYDPKEFEADCFGAGLLLPKTAVLKGLAARGFSPKTLTPEQAYTISAWLGVGYTTLVGNMGRSMGLFGKDQMDALEKVKLPSIRKSLLGFECREHLVPVDEAWTGRPIDVQVGDVILLPPTVAVEGRVVEEMSRTVNAYVVRVVKPGIGRIFISDSGWAQFVRVSRKQFSGLARYRHLEEAEDE
jgi:hypothetical protein